MCELSYRYSAPLPLVLDAVSLAFRLLFRGGGFARDYAEQIETIARTQYGHLDRIGPASGRNFPRPVSHFPSQQSPPNP